MNKRLLLVALATLLAAPSLHADFDSVARAIERSPGVKRTWIPFLSLARFAVWIVQPKGMADFQLAVFEGKGLRHGADFDRILRSGAGKGYTPLVRVNSKKRNDWTYIYARPRPNDRIELLVLAHDPHETVLVRVEVNADELSKHLDEPRRAIQTASR